MKQFWFSSDIIILQNKTLFQWYWMNFDSFVVLTCSDRKLNRILGSKSKTWLSLVLGRWCVDYMFCPEQIQNNYKRYGLYL